MEDRLVELELRFTEQHALLEELSGVVWQQQRQIDALRAEVDAVKKRVAAVEELPTIGAAEKPPHY